MTTYPDTKERYSNTTVANLVASVESVLEETESYLEFRYGPHWKQASFAYERVPVNLYGAYNRLAGIVADLRELAK